MLHLFGQLLETFEEDFYFNIWSHCSDYQWLEKYYSHELCFTLASVVEGCCVVNWKNIYFLAPQHPATVTCFKCDDVSEP